MVNKVNVKYITKKDKTAEWEVFLEIKNQVRASIISSRNLRLTDTRVCMVRESGSFVWPLKKINRVVTEINVKSDERMAISFNRRSVPSNDLNRKAVPVISMFRAISNRIYLKILNN